MLDELKEEVWKANIDLEKNNLVTLTWGNVSGLNPNRDRVVIKPSGVNYSDLTPENLVIVDLEGRRIEGTLEPSSDTPIHLEIYRAFPGIFGVAHTHSTYATIFAQARMPIPCLGTTHADHFRGDVPVTRMIDQKEVEADYEINTGRLIAEHFRDTDVLEMPGVLVAGHGPFTWGKTPGEALLNSVALEKVAEMALGTLVLRKKDMTFPGYLLQKHFLRKHGPKAYYGQKKTGEKE
jgi:L-ribulose-5-phosphate 4-epimerase